MCGWTWCAGLTFGLILGLVWGGDGVAAFAQDAAKKADGAAAATKSAPTTGPRPRKLASGVLQTIPVGWHQGETVSEHDVVELLAVNKEFDFVNKISFRRDIWSLEFQFKPMRLIAVDVPQSTGMMQRKIIWYMVFNVTHSGKVLHPVAQENETYKIETIEKPVRFVPRFLLDSYKLNKAYGDRVMPLAVSAITMHEDPSIRFHTTEELERIEIKPGENYWGVATWEDIDPATNLFSVYVMGLTNAYRWRDLPGGFKAGDQPLSGRDMDRKVLKLNFFRPGDVTNEKEAGIQYGTPGQPDYMWVWRRVNF